MTEENKQLSFDDPKLNSEYESLNNNQRAFISEYIIDFNAKEAAIRSGYSEHTAKVLGCQLLAKLNPFIKSKCKSLLKNKDDIALKVYEELQKIAFSDLRENLIFDNGKANDLVIKEKSETKVIKSIEQGKYGIKITYHDKVRALELLAKISKLAEDKSEIVHKTINNVGQEIGVLSVMSEDDIKKYIEQVTQISH